MSPESHSAERSEEPKEIEAAARKHIQQERGLLERINGKYQRHVRALVCMSAVAASACSEQKDVNTYEETQAERTETDEQRRIRSIQERRLEKFRTMREQQEETFSRARKFADEMGLALEGTVTLKTEGHVVTSINGIPVPEELHTKEEREQIEYARNIRNMMSGESETSGDQDKANKKELSPILESMPLDTEAY